VLAPDDDRVRKPFGDRERARAASLEEFHEVGGGHGVPFAVA
jgi:hypothetical protein